MFRHRYNYAVELTVTEAAERLNVSPRRVRALIERGQLAARRRGPLWLTTSDAVDTYRRSAPGPGRPESTASAWSRLREVASAPHPPDPETALPSLRSRAKARRLRVPDAVAARLGAPPGTMASGAGPLGTTAADGVADLYATVAVARRLVDRLGLDDDPSGQIVLHIVTLTELPDLSSRESFALAWADLADRADPAADVALEALWPGAVPVERLADVIPSRRRIPYAALRAVVDWTTRHPHIAELAVRDRPGPSGNAGIDSLLAGIAETIAEDHGLASPAWTASVAPAPLDTTGTVGPESARWHDVPSPLAARGLGFPRDTFGRPS
jgi:excisionase family DNA binding protein